MSDDGGEVGFIILGILIGVLLGMAIFAWCLIKLCDCHSEYRRRWRDNKSARESLQKEPPTQQVIQDNSSPNHEQLSGELQKDDDNSIL
jgi:hypothetical protein